ncbi:MAG: MFS transporter [Erysipelotrichaceae bacterium]
MSVKNNSKNKISLFEKIAYGGGDLASNLILVLSSTFIVFFYTDALGLNAAIIGMIMLFSRLFDGISDILMGFVVDKTNSKYGKARPWLLWLAGPISVALVLMFMVPNFGDLGKYIYVAITYNLVTTFLYTAINIPYGTLTSLMSRDQDQRMIINVFRMLMAQIGALVINAMTLPLVNSFGGSADQKSWIIVSVMYAILAFVLFMLCFAKTKERVSISSNEQKNRLSFFATLKICLKNDQWLVLVGFWVVMAFGLTMSMTVGTYYAKYILGNENFSGFLMAVSTIPVIVCMPLLPFFIRKIGKCKVAIIGGFISTAAYSMMLLNPISINWLLFCSIIKGIGMAASTGTIFAMIADTIEYGHWKTGIRVEGMLYSSTTFGAKVGAGVGGAIALSILGSVGYDGLLAVQPASVLETLPIIYLYIPIVFSLAMPLLLIAFYKLDKIYPQVIEDLNKQEEA